MVQRLQEFAACAGSGTELSGALLGTDPVPQPDDDVKLADGRTARESYDEELAADRNVEHWIPLKELFACAIVLGVVVIRQLWFV